MKKESHLYLKLFFSMLYLSTFTFGGGYVIISFMRKKFVDDYKWIDEKEILDLTAISQAAPGSIAVNAAVMLGYRLAGVVGVVISVLGTVIPPLVILSVIAVFYGKFIENQAISAILRGMNAGVAAVVCDAAFSLGKGIVKEKSVFSIIIMLGAFISVFFLHIDIKLVIATSGVLGISRMIILRRASKENKNDLY